MEGMNARAEYAQPEDKRGYPLGVALEIMPRDFVMDALCAQTDPMVFFPEKGGSTAEAKRVCAGCEARVECLDYALGHKERYGVWGGLSERERRKLERP